MMEYLRCCVLEPVSSASGAAGLQSSTTMDLKISAREADECTGGGNSLCLLLICCLLWGMAQLVCTFILCPVETFRLSLGEEGFIRGAAALEYAEPQEEVNMLQHGKRFLHHKDSGVTLGYAARLAHFYLFEGYVVGGFLAAFGFLCSGVIADYGEEHPANGKLWALVLGVENKITVAQGSPRG
ncbi:hypothetical protein GRJ2_001744300 [Grus japonensis]|uniref:Uncharacterized protein n=1 Tax=Grus japonensis TaxID=30415 RepID=A0ABC9X532_GRUJA